MAGDRTPTRLLVTIGADLFGDDLDDLAGRLMKLINTRAGLCSVAVTDEAGRPYHTLFDQLAWAAWHDTTRNEQEELF